MEASGKNLRQGLSDEATCPICLDYFKDPVIIPECGHNFCKTCLDQYWGRSESVVSCPQCRLIVEQRKVTPNRALANLIDLTKKWTLRGEKSVRDERSICDKHPNMPQIFFCQDDKVLLCVVCERSKDHRGHQVIPLEEAFEEYKDQIMNYLKFIGESRKEVLSCKTDTEKKSQDLMEQINTERKQIVTAFRKLNQVLEKQEKLLLAQMEEAKEEIERKRKNHMDKLEKEHQSLERLIQEMEEKLHQQPVDFMQDIECLMERCKVKKNCENSPVIFPAALKLKIWDFGDIHLFLERLMKPFQDSLVSGLQLQKANIHLDPETAHRRLVVSKDRKCVRWAQMYQDVLDSPERFNLYHSVLGCEEFTSGRHLWEVTVECKKITAEDRLCKSLKKIGYSLWGFTYEALQDFRNEGL